MVNFSNIEIFLTNPSSSTNRQIAQELKRLFQQDEYAHLHLSNGLLSIGIVTEDYFQSIKRKDEELEEYLRYLDQVLSRIVLSGNMENISLMSGLSGIYYYYLKRYESYQLFREDDDKIDRNLKYYYEYILSCIHRDIENSFIKSEFCLEDLFSIFFLFCRSDNYQFRETFTDILLKYYVDKLKCNASNSNLQDGTYHLVSYFANKLDMQTVLNTLRKHSTDKRPPSYLAGSLRNLFVEIAKSSDNLMWSEFTARDHSSYNDLLFLSLLPKFYSVF